MRGEIVPSTVLHPALPRGWTDYDPKQVRPVTLSYIAHQFAEQFGLKPGTKVLSIGTGTYNLPELALGMYGCQVTVVDGYEMCGADGLPPWLDPFEGGRDGESLAQAISQNGGRYQVVRDRFGTAVASGELRREEFKLVIVANVPQILNASIQDVDSLAGLLSNEGHLVLVVDFKGNEQSLIRRLRKRGVSLESYAGSPYYDLEAHRLLQQRFRTIPDYRSLADAGCGWYAHTGTVYYFRVFKRSI